MQLIDSRTVIILFNLDKTKLSYMRSIGCPYYIVDGNYYYNIDEFKRWFINYGSDELMNTLHVKFNNCQEKIELHINNFIDKCYLSKSGSCIRSGVGYNFFIKEVKTLLEIINECNFEENSWQYNKYYVVLRNALINVLDIDRFEEQVVPIMLKINPFLEGKNIQVLTTQYLYMVISQLKHFSLSIFKLH